MHDEFNKGLRFLGTTKYKKCIQLCVSLRSDLSGKTDGKRDHGFDKKTAIFWTRGAWLIDVLINGEIWYETTKKSTYLLGSFVSSLAAPMGFEPTI